MPKLRHVFSRLFGPAATLALAHAAVLGSVGVHLPFFPLWLASIGLGPAEIAIVLAVPLAQRVVTLPWVTAFAGRLGDLRRSIALFSGISAALFALYPLGGSFAWVVAVTLAYSLLWTATTPILDALTVAVARREGFDYGRVRAFGSVAFVGTAFVAGVLADRVGIGVVPPLLVLLLGGTALVALRLPPDPPGRDGEERPALREGWAALLAVPGLVPVLCGCALLQASHAVLYVAGSVHWKALGYSETAIGLLWAIGVVSEILFFLVSRDLRRRLGFGGFLALAAGGAVLRWAVMALDPPLAATVPMQVLHAFTFAATHIATVTLLANTLPQRFGATAQGAYVALVGGVNGIAYLAAGELYGRLGGGAYGAMLILAVVAAVLLRVGYPRWRRALAD